ncbi:MAG: hypothetical protein KAR79_03945, partial [Simkaniaceae bacterium]|nr:hypothetical protein [Simkaniaceae bacterium]
MLGFLRKYQRFFLVFVFIFVGISFVFFGTSRAFSPKKKTVDFEMGQALDGSKMLKSEIDKMTRFLCTDAFDSSEKRSVIPNFFNDGVLRQDFFHSGIAALLVDAYFEDLKQDFLPRVEKFKTFKPYVHNQVPFICAENLWNQVAPSLTKNFHAFMEEKGEFSSQAIGKLIELYLDQADFPTHLMRQFLMYQQNQIPNLPKDPYLSQGDLGLFHCHSLSDWFGPRFLDLVSQVIHNGAIYAKNQGYIVTDGEAKSQLIYNGYESLKAQKKEGETITDSELSEFFTRQLNYLGLSEKEAVNVWKKVMLFRRLMDDKGRSVFLDPLSYKQRAEFTSRIADLDLYQLPKSLQFTSFHDLLKFKCYLDAVSEESASQKNSYLPEKFCTVKDVESSFPMLVGKSYEMEYALVKKEEIALSVSLKETWDFQRNAENYALLEKAFPELRRKEAKSEAARDSALASLNEELRLQVDQFSRELIVDANPEWISDHLKEAPLKQLKINLSKYSQKIPLEEIEDVEKFYDLLDTCAYQEGSLRGLEEMRAKKALESTTFDGKTYYRIHLVNRDQEKRIFTFAESEEIGVIEPLLEGTLKDAYSNLRKMDPGVFLDESGLYKSFHEVQDFAGKYYYADLMKQIENSYTMEGNALEKGSLKEDLTFYTKYFFYYFMKNSRLALVENKELPVLDSLANQWKLEKTEITYRTKDSSPYVDESIFSLEPNTWSDLSPAKNGALTFFQ